MPIVAMRSFTLCLVMCAVALISAPAADQPPVPESTVIAHAGKIEITARDVLIRMILSEGDITLQRLLTRHMVEAEAEHRGVRITDEKLDSTLQADLAQYRAELALEHPEDAPKYTADQLIELHFHQPLETYRRRELYYALLMQGLCVAPGDLADNRLRAWYEHEKDRYGKPTQYIVRHILVKYDADPEQTLAMSAGDRDIKSARRKTALLRAQKKAEQIYDLLKTGQPFEQLEKKYSDEIPQVKARGGALPPVDIHTPLDATFLEAVRNLTVGQCSPPVLTSFGYHIILLDKIIPGQSPAYEAVAAQIQRDYSRQLVAERAAPLMEQLSQNTEVTHLKYLYPSADEDLSAPTPVVDGAVKLSDCVAVLGRVAPDALTVPLNRAVTRHEFYAELWRTAGRKIIEERAALGLYMQKVKGLPADPTEIEVSQVFSADQINCYALQDRAIAEAKQRNLPVPERRKFYEYMHDLTNRTPAELKADARERAALWKFMKVKFPWTQDEIEKYFYIERERYDIPGELKLALILVRPQSDPLSTDPEKPSSPVAADQANAEQWQNAAARARTLYQRMRGAGLPADTDRRVHPEMISWEYAAKRMSDAPEEVTAVAGDWTPLKVVRVPRVDEMAAIDANRSGYDLVVLDFDPMVGREALNLTDGEITAPIRGREGYYLLKRAHLQQPFAQTLEDPEVYRQVERDCISPRIRKNLQPELDRLLQDNPIQIDEPLLARLTASKLR